MEGDLSARWEQPAASASPYLDETDDGGGWERRGDRRLEWGRPQQSSLFDGIDEGLEGGGDSPDSGEGLDRLGLGQSGGLEAQSTGRSYGMVDDYDADAVLDEGPLRFAPHGERPLSAQILSLGPDEKACFEDLRRRWAEKGGNERGDLSDEMVLWFARCSPGPAAFDAESAWRAMRTYDPRYLNLTAADVEDHLRSRAFVVAPGLRIADGHEVLYMRPSRYPAFEPSPSSSLSSYAGGGGSVASSSIAAEPALDGLVYCIQSLLQKERNSAEGVALLADMSDWEFGSHFSAPLFHQLVLMLQGRIPVQIRLFLIVNPPAWFRTAFRWIRPVMKQELRDKVRVVEGMEDAGRYMAQGYEDFLPDDAEGGRADSRALVEDFVRYRKHVEGAL